MAPINHHTWIFIFGLLGNIVSFMVYLAPVPTFLRVYKKKSTEGFQSVPYVCAVFSSMLWIYYAMVKTNSLLLITINSFGCVVETIYIAIFLTYADKQAKMSTIKLVVLLNLVGFSTILIACHYLPSASLRVQVLGWICVGFAVIVFAAPLSVIRMVIRTKSVEFMPFPLSLTLTISAVMWFMYGMLQKDMYIVFPNIMGFTFGVAQMVLYGIYRNHKPVANKVEDDIEMKLPETFTITTATTCDDASLKPKDDVVTTGETGHSLARICVENKEDADHTIHGQADGQQADDAYSTAHGPACRVDEMQIRPVGAPPAAGTATAAPLVGCAI